MAGKETLYRGVWMGLICLYTFTPQSGLKQRKAEDLPRPPRNTPKLRILASIVTDRKWRFETPESAVVRAVRSEAKKGGLTCKLWWPEPVYLT
jgi:hypothetical protein